jgi:hypothetical protein
MTVTTASRTVPRRLQSYPDRVKLLRVGRSSKRRNTKPTGRGMTDRAEDPTGFRMLTSGAPIGMQAKLPRSSCIHRRSGGQTEGGTAMWSPESWARERIFAWRRASSREDVFELWLPHADQVLATLTVDDGGGLAGRLDADGRRFVLTVEDMPPRRVRISDAGTRTVVASFERRRIAHVGTVRFAEGRELGWRRSGLLHPTFAFIDRHGNPLLRFERGGDVVGYGLGAGLDPLIRSWDAQLLLLALGLFLLVIHNQAACGPSPSPDAASARRQDRAPGGRIAGSDVLVPRRRRPAAGWAVPLRGGLVMWTALLVAAVPLSGCTADGQLVTLVYVDLTNSTAAFAASTLRDLQVVLDTVVSEHGRLLVDAVDDNALAHARVVADASFAVPEAQGNRLVERRKVAERKAAVTAAVTALLGAPRPARFTDVFAALAAAGLRLQAFPARERRRVVFLSDMVSNAPGRRLSASRWDSAAIGRLLAGLRANHMLPSLPGVEVWVGGAGLATGDRLPAAKVLEIRAVWQAVFAATGARLTVYGPQLLQAAGKG